MNKGEINRAMSDLWSVIARCDLCEEKNGMYFWGTKK